MKKWKAGIGRVLSLASNAVKVAVLAASITAVAPDDAFAQASTQPSAPPQSSAPGASSQAVPGAAGQARQPGQAPAGFGDPWPGKKKLLIIADVQTGFHHDSINHAMAVIERLGRESGAYISVIRTDSQLLTKEKLVGTGARYSGRSINARNLDFFDAVFFLGAGAGTLTDKQKADFLSFVHDDGKGLIVGHAATVAYFDWPEFLDMIGGFMEYEYPVDTMTLLNSDPNFPGAAVFPSTFTYRDQFPVMKAPFSSVDVHVILRLDPSRLTSEQRARRPDGDVPVVWAKTYGKGRVFNDTIGHLEEVWDDPKFQQLTLGGIKWALGLADADLSPSRYTANGDAGKTTSVGK